MNGHQTKVVAGLMASPRLTYRERLRLIICRVPHSERWWRDGGNNATIKFHPTKRSTNP